MVHLVVRNIGPIKDIELDLNKVNLFMGPQSCGKSTLAKIISYCSWFEKNMILKTITKDDFYKELIEFHNLEDSYFSDESYIEYITPCCHILFSGRSKEQVNVEVTVDKDHRFENRKIEYIPAERNFVALKGLGKYTDSKDNILNFLYDWFQAKQYNSKENKYPLPVPSLSASYFYDKTQDADRILLENGKDIGLRHSSSGLMSVTPLLLVFDYILNGIYTQKRTKTPFEITRIQERIDKLNEEQHKQIIQLLEKISRLQSDWDKKEKEGVQESQFKSFRDELSQILENLNNIVGIYSDYFYSEVIIEEPELNLFPETQRDLLYYMLRTLNATERKHVLVLTTHSPYILFALNNCMMGGLVKEAVPDSEANTDNFLSYGSWIDPKQVSVYEIHDGGLKCIQDEDGIIEDNYLNQAYKKNSSEYLALLGYYEDEK